MKEEEGGGREDRKEGRYEGGREGGREGGLCVPSHRRCSPAVG